jgi:hypothetical protein
MVISTGWACDDDHGVDVDVWLASAPQVSSDSEGNNLLSQFAIIRCLIKRLAS